MKKSDFVKILEKMPARSAWQKGVIEYAIEILENVPEDDFKHMNRKLFLKYLLNGAGDWQEYSCGGCALIYDRDIAKRLCNKTELSRTNFGKKEPNKSESWLDVQTRALCQAESLLLDIFNEA